MLGTLNAIYGGSKEHSFKASNGQTLKYTMINLLGTADYQDEHLSMSTASDFDCSQLERFKEYNFIVDVTNQEKGKKIKVIGIIPFEKDDKK